MLLFIYQWNYDSYNSEFTDIKIYGINKESETICLRVENFQPYIYVKIKNYKIIQPLIIFLQEFNFPGLKIDIHKRKHLYNQKNNLSGENVFLFISCKAKNNLSIISQTLEKGIKLNDEFLKLQVEEKNVNPILQYVCKNKIPTAGWITFEGEEILNHKLTSCKEFIVKKIYNYDSTSLVIPKCLAFDLEVFSEANRFPNNDPGDIIFQISCVIQTTTIEKYLFTFNDKKKNLENNDLLKDTQVFVFSDEKSLLYAFIQFVSKQKPNLITGYNIFGFDIDYLIKRTTRYFLIDDLKKIGFNKKNLSPVEEIKWSSSAYSKQSFKFINWEGILLVDLLNVIRRDYHLENYTLKNVSNYFLKNNEKDPLTYKDIFKACKTRTNLDIVGKYCVQDSNLCIHLFNTLNIWVSMSEMAKICNVSMFTLYTQGQQIKLFCQVYKYCQENKIIVDSNIPNFEKEKFRGAYVLEPEPGLYNKVVSVDFSSLYPSLMIAYNICYSTILDEKTCLKYSKNDYQSFEWEDHIGCEHDPKKISINELSEKISELDLKIKKKRNIRDATKKKTEKIRIQDEMNQLKKEQKPFREERANLKKSNPEFIICKKRKFKFLKPTIKKGVIPIIIQNLLDFRKITKEKLKNTENEIEKIILDKKQLAYKVSANSMYGAMGTEKGYLPFLPGGMCITFLGRKSLIKTAELINDKFQGKIIYGDTDSNYIIFPNIKDLDELWEYSKKVANLVTNWKENDQLVFPRPIKLEFENIIYNKFLLLSKKRYMYQEIDKNGVKKPKIGKKGVLLTRRDNCDAVRKAYETVTMMIFENKTKKQIQEYLENYTESMFSDEIPNSEFIITKSIRDYEYIDIENHRIGDYKFRNVPDNAPDIKKFALSCVPAHVQLAERMKKRGSDKIDPGTRMEFVILKNYSSSKKLCDRIEDYYYFQRHQDILKIDYIYYLKSLVNPLDQLFKILKLWTNDGTNFEYTGKD